MPTLNPRDAALARLTNHGVPMPQDWVPDLGPEAALFFMKECCEAVLMALAGSFAQMAQAGDEVDEVAAETLNGAGQALTGTTHALVSLGLLPAEAEQALEEVQ